MNAQSDAGNALFRSRLLLVVAVALAYSSSFGGVYLLDDLDSITRNPAIRQLWPLWRPMFGSDFATVTGRPVLSLSLALNYAISGKHIWSYHLVNLLLHVTVCLLLAGVARQTLLRPGMPTGFSSNATWLSAAVALIWGLHPLTTAAVTYVVQRGEMLVAICYLGAMYAIVRDARSSARTCWQVLAFALCWLGMGAKEVMATAPIVILLFDRAYLSDSWQNLWHKRGILHVAMACGWMPLAVLMFSSAGRQATAGIGYGTTMLDYFLTQLLIVPEYLKLTVAPVGQSIDWGIYLVQSPDEWIVPGILVGCLGLITIWAWRAHRRWGFLGVWFFAILAPTSSVVPLVTQTAAEHRMYLPLMSLCILFVLAVWAGGMRMASTANGDLPPTRATRIVVPALMVVAAILGVLTFQRNFVYHNGVTAWADAVQNRPSNPRAYANLAVYLTDAGRPAEAEAVASRGIDLDPLGDRTGWYNNGTRHLLGGLYYGRCQACLHQNKLEQCVDDASRALYFDPTLREALTCRALASVNLGRFQDALADCDILLHHYPREIPEAYAARATANLGLNRLPEAARDYRAASALGYRFDPAMIARMTEAGIRTSDE